MASVYRRLIKKIDTDEDGLLSKEELMQWLKKTEEKANLEDIQNSFIKEDLNEDGYVTFEEFLTNSGMTDGQFLYVQGYGESVIVFNYSNNQLEGFPHTEVLFAYLNKSLIPSILFFLLYIFRSAPGPFLLLSPIV